MSDTGTNKDVPLHRQLGLTDEEHEAVVALLGRAPSDEELAMYAVMWSEHCSYKSSRTHLRRLPTEAPWVLVGPGEGAGVIDVGDGLAVAIRIESHNHPSAVEPYQGAATGVGGIIRDIFSMGARPIALMDPLRFGRLDDPRVRYLFEGVVAGISGYGNAVGVPTVGGEVIFDESYRDNPLVNVLCLGVLPQERMVLARAEGEGNLAVLLGAATGRDGIGGASVLASAGFEESDDEKRPSVQVGDPFEEKKLIEACLALLEAGLAVGVQDLGAAGISCAASETAANAGAGMDLDVARVPRREPGMTPVEVLTSESQERMLAIVTPENLDEVIGLCDRWEIRSSVVGRVTDTGRFRVFNGTFDALGVAGCNPPPPGSEQALIPDSDRAPVADVPVGSLGDGPVYDRPLAPPADRDAVAADDPAPRLRAAPGTNDDCSHELLALLSIPDIADKSWVWHQYDHQLFLNTVVGPGHDAAVLRLEGTQRGLALSTDGNARFCRLDPRTGARLAVLEAARNVACTGAHARALVNCLNFGNPEHPEVMWQFSEVIDGMREACVALGIPVVGGNVSFYNESDGYDIDPTPVVGVVGVIEDLAAPPPQTALRPGVSIVVLGETAEETGGTQWARSHGLDGGRPPAADLGRAAALHGLLVDVVGRPDVVAVHDCSDGGLAVALAEMAITGDVGFTVDLDAVPVVAVGSAGADSDDAVPTGALCFAESASRVILGVEPSGVDEVLELAAGAGVPGAVVGRTEATEGVARLTARESRGGGFDVALDAATDAWRRPIPDAVGADLAPRV